jgi:hypothetical protein
MTLTVYKAASRKAILLPGRFDRVDLEGDHVDRTNDVAFWATRAAGYLEPLLAAAMLTGQGAVTVAGWITRAATGEAEDILRAHGLGDEAERLAELRIEPPLAAAPIRATMTAALARQDPQS